MNVQVSCIAMDCTQSPVEVCIQCGRAFCAQHGGRQAGYGDRCRECYTTFLDGLVNSYYRAGKLDEVLHILNGSELDDEPPEYIYYHSLALAASGDLAKAISKLKGLHNDKPRDSLDSLVRQSLAAMLSARAINHLQTGAMINVINDLRVAADLSPDTSVERDELFAALAYQSALEYFKAGRLSDALNDWEEIQKQKPHDLRVMHYLAVIYYRMATELEDSKPLEADRYWKLVIAHWVVVLVNPQFWTQWANRRRQSVGEISEEILSDVMQSTIDRLQTNFREYRSHYIEENNLERAKYHAEYEVDFTLERHAARSMLKAMRNNGLHQEDPGFACGPLMLDYLRSMNNAKNLVADLAPLIQGNRELNKYFSPLGRYYVMVMVEEINRYRDAQPGLENWLKNNPNDREAQELLVRSLIKSGKELLEIKDAKGAVELFEKAAKYGLQNQNVLPLLSKAATDYTTTILLEEISLYKNDSDFKDQKILRNAFDVIEPAIALLARLHNQYHLSSDADFMAQLAQAYFRRGLIRNQLNQYQASLEDFNRVLGIDANHPGANENYAIITMNRAVDFLNANNPEQAFVLLTEIINRSPERVDRKLAGKIYFNLGIKHANEAITPGNYIPNLNICERLRNALTWLEIAIQYDPDERQYRIERDKIQNFSRQLKCW